MHQLPCPTFDSASEMPNGCIFFGLVTTPDLSIGYSSQNLILASVGLLFAVCLLLGKLVAHIDIVPGGT